MTRARDERGSVSGELVILSVVFFAFAAAIVLAGRLNVSSAHVEAAARSAARTISIARDPQAAVAEARDQAEQTANAGSSVCDPMGFTADIDDAEVTVEVTCVVDLSQAALVDVPGSRTLSATATEVVDRYRENSNEFGLSEGSGASNPSTGDV